ncbi:NAD(P)H-hydrate dehydratase [Noviherbaspirillum aerium]|uniref:NAD(P)H-hydrate dehydratase n=1 Tax=Noviherbaspirillum aerium TaxID=2588497 RepID=UPI00124F68F1|nr:NAD(P)H-hydrate dehydratase [Noviherbaspirillum aerium]
MNRPPASYRIPSPPANTHRQDPTALFSVAEIRAIEEKAMADIPPGTLMQRAAKAAASLALALLSRVTDSPKVLLVAGPGNNGGDALVMACLLADAGLHPTVMVCADPARQPDDAQRALERAQAVGVRLIAPNPEAVRHPVHWDLVVDGLFGIGLARPISGALHSLVGAINSLDCPVLALDVPSGLDADTGCVIGGGSEGGIAVRATHTLTFIGNKPGLHTCDGRDHAGEVQVAALDIAPELFVPAHAWLGSISQFSSSLRKRLHSSHKGSYGDVAVIGGAHGMVGAPVLSARAAAKSGAGRVFIGFLDEPLPYDAAHPELMCRHASELDFRAGAVVIGPGLGTSDQAQAVLLGALQADMPLVLDADALNLLALHVHLREALAARTMPSLMTPHPLEAARLLRISTPEVQSSRLEVARSIARECNSVVILKGSGSVIARPDGKLIINATGNPALATAGSGDVLAGMCGALLAQSFPVWDAALAATWMHGRAADRLIEDGIGPIGVTASELIPMARAVYNELTEQHAGRDPAI